MLLVCVSIEESGYVFRWNYRLLVGKLWNEKYIVILELVKVGSYDPRQPCDGPQTVTSFLSGSQWTLSLISLPYSYPLCLFPVPWWSSQIPKNKNLPDWRMGRSFVVRTAWGRWRLLISNVVRCWLFRFQNCKPSQLGETFMSRNNATVTLQPALGLGN